jgi:hypothetical protein
LSWEEAVVLHELLTDQIALYEEHAGPIRRWDTPPPIDAESNGNPPEEPDDEEG